MRELNVKRAEDEELTLSIGIQDDNSGQQIAERIRLRIVAFIISTAINLKMVCG